jgi:hypothetical protein
MSFADNQMTSPWGNFAAQANADARAEFIRKTYLHLAGAIGAFAAIKYFLLQMPNVGELVQTMIGGRWSWLIVIGAFMGVSYIADSWSRSATSKAMQYAGLGLYVVAQAIITLPLLYIADNAFQGQNVIPTAATITLVLFGGLTAIAFITGKDFSFLRGVLMLAGFAAMGLIFCSILFGFNLGTVFMVAMVALAAGYILYDTSNVMHHYRTDQYVSASLALFASVALMFWYVLQLVMSMSRR